MRFALALILASSAALADSTELRFGMASAPTSKELAAKHAKQLEPYLSKVLKRKVSVTVTDSYAALVDSLIAGTVDAAWMQPLPFVRAKAKNEKITPVVKVIRNGAGFYRSVLFARAKKGISTLGDLKGKRAAWVDQHSTSGYLFPLVLLHAQGYDADKVFVGQDFHGSHLAVCKAVESGKADVGATYMDVPAEGKPMEIDGCKGGANLKNLVVIDLSGPISNDVIAVKGGTSAEDSAAIKAAFETMSKDAAGKKILKEIFECQEFGPVGENDFAAVSRGWEIIRDMNKLDLTEK